MQIIGGKFKGKRFPPVKEFSVRPTAARVREAIFDILSFQIQNARVLDLFAGTGAMGLEALSRGALFAVFIDQNRKILSQIDKSIHQLALEKQTLLLRWDISRNLNCIRKPLSIHSQANFRQAHSSHPAGFTLVFIDPPYNKALIEKTLHHLNTSGALIHHAVIVIEHDLSESIPKSLLAYRLTDQRKYGRTYISFLEYNGC